ncbi:hypothetical protein D3C86_931740 [compost metagenome]
MVSSGARGLRTIVPVASAVKISREDSSRISDSALVPQDQSPFHDREALSRLCSLRVLRPVAATVLPALLKRSMRVVSACSRISWSGVGVQARRPVRLRSSEPMAPVLLGALKMWSSARS